MLLYENAYPSNYEEIKTWYPEWYREVIDMDALWRVFGKQLDEVQSGIIQAVNNNFIDFADSQTIAKLEEFLIIGYDSPRTLAERRDIIKAFIIGRGRIGQKEIKELISVFTGGEITVSLIGGTVKITVTRDFGDRFNLYDCKMVLDQRIPAHLALDFEDNLSPVSVTNKECLIFRSINIAIAVKNRTAQLTGSGVLLNGKRKLDGSWKLDTSSHGIPFINFGVKIQVAYKTDIVAQRLNMGVYTVQNDSHVTTRACFQLSATNSNSMSQVSVNISGSKAIQASDLIGTVIMDGRWKLDGSVKLDGSRRLNQIYKQEEL